MGLEQTLSIIKPDAVKANNIGEIIAIFEKNGLRVVAAKMMQLTACQAKAFYAVHAQRSFFGGLVSFMTSGPVMVMVLEGERAIAANRELMGDTNPKEAAEGTIRARFGRSIGDNAVHGSDSAATAKEEVAFFFAASDLHSY